MPQSPIYATRKLNDIHIHNKWPLAREGLPFIIPVFGLTCVFVYFGFWTAALLAGILTVFTTFFFRDPERSHSASENAVLAPADGRVRTERKQPDHLFNTQFPKNYRGTNCRPYRTTDCVLDKKRRQRPAGSAVRYDPVRIQAGSLSSPGYTDYREATTKSKCGQNNHRLSAVIKPKTCTNYFQKGNYAFNISEL